MSLQNNNLDIGPNAGEDKLRRLFYYESILASGAVVPELNNLVNEDVERIYWRLVNEGIITLNVTGSNIEANLPSRLSDVSLNSKVKVSVDGVISQLAKKTVPYLKQEEKIASWLTALQSAGTAHANIHVMGDSISEGSGNSTIVNRWINHLQDALTYRHGYKRGAVFPFIPAWPKTSVADVPVERSGTVDISTELGAGLGWRTAVLKDDTSTLTFTFTGTKFKVAFFGASGTTKANVSIDGGAPTIIETNTGIIGAGTYVYSRSWESPALTAGEHTIVVKRDPSATAGQSVYIQGLITYDADETAGVRVFDASHHGSTSRILTQVQSERQFDAMYVAGPPNAVVIALGTNDYGNNFTPQEYFDNISRMVNVLRTRTTTPFTGTIILVNCYKASGRDEALWREYGEKLRQIAASDTNIAYFDWRLRMPDIPAPFDDPAGLKLFRDTLHPNDEGSKYIGYVMADYLSNRA